MAAMRRFLLGLSLAAGFLGLGCSHACTLIGCRDEVSIHLHTADWLTPTFAAEITVDGRRVTCPEPERGKTAEPCAPDVTVGHRELMDCQERRTATATQLTCLPNGKFEQVISIAGTPAAVRVVLSSGGTQVADREFSLAYLPFYPNGPECGAPCRQATTSWQLP